MNFSEKMNDAAGSEDLRRRDAARRRWKKVRTTVAVTNAFAQAGKERKTRTLFDPRMGVLDHTDPR